MKQQSVAFDDARSALRRLGLPDKLPDLHAAGLGISRAVLGGSHSVAVYPPIDSLLPVDGASLIGNVRCEEETSLYVHIPFCETRCTFCHYAVHHYAGRGQGSDTQDSEVARYLAALKQELRFWGRRLAASGTMVSSIYIGGGTPLVLDQASLGDLLATIRTVYDVRPGAELCIEGSPLTIAADDGADKLRFLKEQGVTRLSFGVQSFDDAVLKYAARGYKRDVPIRAAMIANDIFDNWNLDLIQGLYKGSPQESWDNLQVVAELRPAHLTWYHGRFADRPQGQWYNREDKQASFEDEAATLLGRTLIWQEMADLGYQRSDGNRFVQQRRHVDGFKKIRTSLSSNLLGVGTSSYSHVGARANGGGLHGYIFRNEPDMRRYVERMSAGEPPVATARAIDDEELLATSYATGLRGGRVESDAVRAIRTQRPELSAHYQALETALIAIGILEPYAGEDGASGVQLSDLGRLFEDETLSLFFSPSVQQALAMGASCH